MSTFGSDHRRALEALDEGIELAERSGADGYLAWLKGRSRTSSPISAIWRRRSASSENPSRWPRRWATSRSRGSSEPAGVHRVPPRPARRGRRDPAPRERDQRRTRAASRGLRLPDRGCHRARAGSRGRGAGAVPSRRRTVTWVHARAGAGAVLRAGPAPRPDGDRGSANTYRDLSTRGQAPATRRSRRGRRTPRGRSGASREALRCVLGRVRAIGDAHHAGALLSTSARR